MFTWYPSISKQNSIGRYTLVEVIELALCARASMFNNKSSHQHSLYNFTTTFCLFLWILCLSGILQQLHCSKIRKYWIGNLSTILMASFRRIISGRDGCFIPIAHRGIETSAKCNCSVRVVFSQSLFFDNVKRMSSKTQFRKSYEIYALLTAWNHIFSKFPKFFLFLAQIKRPFTDVLTYVL